MLSFLKAFWLIGCVPEPWGSGLDLKERTLVVIWDLLASCPVSAPVLDAGGQEEG